VKRKGGKKKTTGGEIRLPTIMLLATESGKETKIGLCFFGNGNGIFVFGSVTSFFSSSSSSVDSYVSMC